MTDNVTPNESGHGLFTLGVIQATSAFKSLLCKTGIVGDK